MPTFSDTDGKAVGFGVIGTGMISGLFAETLNSMSGAKLRAVYSRNLDTGRTYAEKYRAEKVYTDLSAMLSDPAVDAVYVASPTVCHAEHTVAALRKGKHVLCEKAFSTDYRSARLMLDTASECGLVLLEAMRPNHDPFYLKLSECIERIGTVRSAHLEYCQYSSRYDRFKNGILTNAFDPQMKNSAISDIGIYPFTVAVNLFGEPSEIQHGKVRLDNGFIGSGSLLLSYPEKTVTVTYSKLHDGMTPSVIEGELGTVTVDRITTPTRIELSLRADGEKNVIKNGFSGCNMLFEISDFIDMIKGKKDNSPYLALTERVMRLLDGELY